MEEITVLVGVNLGSGEQEICPHTLPLGWKECNPESSEEAWQEVHLGSERRMRITSVAHR